ncbi:MAG: multicopper oxidase domain-containing protein [Streptosporangiales bacterium]|nr:multicopper oxidase domain-containing protein [Streptosporangiales bacterium]
MCARSFAPPTYSVMGMGRVDFGGGPALGGHLGHTDDRWVGPARRPGDVSVADLTGPRDVRPDVSTTLVARKGPVTLATGEKVDGYSLNGSSPGPPIRARQGDVVQVRLVNANIAEGTTLHWHGVDVPNAEDGVAGVTQNAVPAGRSHVYRFVAEDAGTYWYHSHQISSEQVRDGLWGTLVVEPRGRSTYATDVVAPVHSYGGLRTVAGRTGEYRVPARPGTTARVRVIDTDNGPLRLWAGGGYRVLAVDGRDVHRPTPVHGKSVVVGAGGRVDLEVAVPASGDAVRVELGGGSAVVVGPAGSSVRRTPEPSQRLDLLSYGSPAKDDLRTAKPDRVFDYRVGRRPGFINGKPGMYWSINGRLFPDVPMYVVAEGDIVRMKIHNGSGEAHPMHLHGHHALVLSRNGVPASGSEWWVDSLNVQNGESYEVAFRADNPGLWMDHCHNLPHVNEGLMAHLMYAGVYGPYRIGDAAGSHNKPE